MGRKGWSNGLLPGIEFRIITYLYQWLLFFSCLTWSSNVLQLLTQMGKNCSGEQAEAASHFQCVEACTLVWDKKKSNCKVTLLLVQFFDIVRIQARSKSKAIGIEHKPPPVEDEAELENDTDVAEFLKQVHMYYSTFLKEPGARRNWSCLVVNLKITHSTALLYTSFSIFPQSILSHDKIFELVRELCQMFFIVVLVNIVSSSPVWSKTWAASIQTLWFKNKLSIREFQLIEKTVIQFRQWNRP